MFASNYSPWTRGSKNLNGSWSRTFRKLEPLRSLRSQRASDFKSPCRSQSKNMITPSLAFTCLSTRLILQLCLSFLEVVMQTWIRTRRALMWNARGEIEDKPVSFLKCNPHDYFLRQPPGLYPLVHWRSMWKTFIWADVTESVLLVYTFTGLGVCPHTVRKVPLH